MTRIEIRRCAAIEAEQDEASVSGAESMPAADEARSCRAGAPSRMASAATSGIRTMKVSTHQPEDREVDQADDAEAEEKGVGLEVAELEEAQSEAERPGRAAQAADEHAIDEPSGR